MVNVNKEAILAKFKGQFWASSRLSIEVNDAGRIDVIDPNSQGDEKVELERGPRLSVRFGQFDASFDGGSQPLTSLLGSPKHTTGSFNVDECNLTTLKGGPESVGASYSCCRNPITSLEGAPKIVEAKFNCSDTRITNLVGCPQNDLEQLIANNCKLTNLVGIPPWVAYLSIRNNPLRSLEGIQGTVGVIHMTYQPNLPLMRLLAVKINQISFVNKNGGEEHTDLASLLINNQKIYEISRNKAMLKTQQEMINMGYPGNAKW